MRIAVIPFALHAQDTTQVYPWRLSYFPYVTTSPNNGFMLVARAIGFRQSRWDDRVSLHDAVAIDAGYSAKNAWLLRVRGDFPRIADGWRLQVIGQASYETELEGGTASTRQTGSIEVTRRVAGPASIAVRGDVLHATLEAFTSMTPNGFQASEARGRIALVLDYRDREYDTRKGALLQGGGFVGSSNGMKGWYALASGWVPLDESTRITVRAGVRIGTHMTSEGVRTMPAWEDNFVLGGGPQSNRALPIAWKPNAKMMLWSAEIRHDVFTFPGGALGVLAFVDANREYCDCQYLTDGPGFVEPKEWTVGPGGGIALRLLRNAILTATIARAEGATRVYVSSGWSW